MLENIELNENNTIDLAGDLYDILYDILEETDIVFSIKQDTEEIRKITIISDADIFLVGQTLIIEYFRYSSKRYD